MSNQMKDALHVVVDLETLDTRPNAAVLSVGVAFVKTCAVVDAIELRLDLSEQLMLGRTVSASTLEWWLDGAKADAQRHTASLPRYALSTALESIEARVRAYGGPKGAFIWGNSPSFDCAILASLYAAAGMPPWWGYSQEMDLRTLRKFGLVKWQQPLIAHTALHDAQAEAEELVGYLRTL